ncbi:TNT domain-containing protein [Corynebacterium sp. zg-331]|uniref:TNT domain-containing protein n=1 Tax=unclassified Corynebacterium TaxID=2624378 RepID=UPI00128B4CEB|nr:MULTISPECIES: TNT domain-containing protein [unclassified Corynebacterium]MBC3185243.1 TNT domain-containing protein [Corynebacterium sp. zg-331]MPV51741.1 DUF4237 domain-containing protein [Corynebacterium sp. zg331]
MIDRLGSKKGNYLWNATDSFPMRSLPPWIEMRYYAKFERTDTPLPEGVQMRYGKIAPAFEQPGGGTQYLFEKVLYRNGEPVDVEFFSVEELVAHGILREVE